MYVIQYADSKYCMAVWSFGPNTFVNNNKIYLSLADILKLCILLAHTSMQMYVCK